jgi:uncharacterized protein
MTSHTEQNECKTAHAINWFEIPVKDIERAAKFYSEVTGKKMGVEKWSGFQMAVFPGGGHGIVHGALVQGEGYEPSDKGTVVYLNGGEDLNVSLQKVPKAGGTVLRPKFSIGDHGHIAFFKDTEGNKVALHSMK